jgi:hypothetical protein
MTQGSVQQLTPSEIELLNTLKGEGEAIFGQLTNVLSQGEIWSITLLERLLCAAIDANREIGVFRVEFRPCGSLFGLRKRQRLAISANGSMHRWPTPSLEASLAEVLRSSFPSQVQMTIADLVRVWYQKGAFDHLQASIRWVYDALVERGLVERQTERRLDLFGLTRYVLTDEFSGVAAELASESNEFASSSNSVSDTEVEELLEWELERELRRLNHYIV